VAQVSRETALTDLDGIQLAETDTINLAGTLGASGF
jgi:hypothetical protein